MQFEQQPLNFYQDHPYFQKVIGQMLISDVLLGIGEEVLYHTRIVSLNFPDFLLQLNNGFVHQYYVLQIQNKLRQQCVIYAFQV